MNKTIRLCELKVGEVARVLDISPENTIRRRLLDMGLIKGTDVTCLLQSPTGGMRAYSVRGACVAIRDVDVCDVLVERGEANGTD